LKADAVNYPLRGVDPLLLVLRVEIISKETERYTNYYNHFELEEFKTIFTSGEPLNDYYHMYL